MRPQLRAPSHLRPATRRWWVDVVRSYELEEHHVKLLTAAAECWDRLVQARELLAAEGIVTKDRFGCPRKHPAIGIEENARTGFARLVRELGLDVDGPNDAPRPPARRGTAGRG